MDRAGLPAGARVRVVPCETAASGAIVVVRRAAGGLLVKRLWKSRPCKGYVTHWLTPDSTDASHEARPMAEGDRIVGVVAGTPERDPAWVMHRPHTFPASEIPAPKPRRPPEPPIPAAPPRAPERFTASGKPARARLARASSAPAYAREGALRPLTPLPFVPRLYIAVWAEPELMPDAERTPPLARLMISVRRELAGMSDPDIERTLGLRRGELAEYDAGHVPPLDTLMRLARRIETALGVSVLGAEETMRNIANGRMR